MAVSTIQKEILVKDFTHTFPAFPSGSAGSRVDYVSIDASVSGYRIIGVNIATLIAGATFMLLPTFRESDGVVFCSRNRTGGNAESAPTTVTFRVTYQKI